MVLAEMANPMPWAEAITAVLIPTTSPLRFRRGPPELPGLIAVWMRSWSIGSPGCSMVRPSALTTPAVTVGPPSIQIGLPIATTVSPTASLDEAASLSAGRLRPSILRTARSVNRSAPTMVARKTRPSVNATLISSAPSIT